MEKTCNFCKHSYFHGDAKIPCKTAVGICDYYEKFEPIEEKDSSESKRWRDRLKKTTTVNLKEFVEEIDRVKKDQEQQDFVTRIVTIVRELVEEQKEQSGYDLILDKKKKDEVAKESIEKLERAHETIVNQENISRENDPVQRPSHYTFGKFEVIDVLMDWFPEEPLLWQVGKYIARAKHKGNEIQDLKKAKFYLEKKIKLLEKK